MIAKKCVTLPKLAIKMHSQTVWILFFYLFCCLTSLLGYLLIGVNVWHTNHPSCGPFFSIPRQSGMYVSQWKKQSKGNHMKQNYTPDLVLNQVAEYPGKSLQWTTLLSSFKNGPKVFQQKPQDSPLDCSSHISFAWYYHEKSRRHRKFESHGSQRQKKNRDGGFSWVDIPGTNETSTHSKWQIGRRFLIFTMER